jgi:hypothetical protein
MASTVWAGDEDKVDQATGREEQVDKVIRDQNNNLIRLYENISKKRNKPVRKVI